MTATDDFLRADGPLHFLNHNILTISLGDSTRETVAADRTRRFRLQDTTVLARGGHFHWYNKKMPVYLLTQDPDGPIDAFLLGFKANDAVGSILSNMSDTPRYMFTVTMNSCSLGFAQPDGAHGCYVSHHNLQNQGNDSGLMEQQDPQFVDGQRPDLSFVHRDAYMRDATDTHNSQYRSTTIGWRDANGIWRFYMQKRKYHGQLLGGTNNNFSFKGVVQVNPAWVPPDV